MSQNSIVMAAESCWLRIFASVLWSGLAALLIPQPSQGLWVYRSTGCPGSLTPGRPWKAKTPAPSPASGVCAPHCAPRRGHGSACQGSAVALGRQAGDLLKQSHPFQRGQDFPMWEVGVIASAGPSKFIWGAERPFVPWDACSRGAIKGWTPHISEAVAKLKVPFSAEYCSYTIIHMENLYYGS